MRKMKALLDAQEKQLQSRRLKVGFAAGATYPDGTLVPVVAYTNEVGRPEKRQPPRPFSVLPSLNIRRTGCVPVLGRYVPA
ncbi:hypothetical protein SODG_004934 [Sodalis praecaptivus]